MSALPTTVCNPQTPPSVDDTFMEYLPAIQRHAGICFRHLSEVDREEAVAEATAAAFCNFRTVSRRGKADVVTPSTLARFAVLHVKDARHVGGSRENRSDVMNRRAQQARGFKVLDLPWDDGRLDCLKQSHPSVWRLNLLHDRRTPPSDQAAFRIDLSGFLARQTDRVRTVMALLAAGHKRAEVADHLGVTPSAVTQRMDRVRQEWGAFQGEPAEPPVDPSTR